MSALTDAKLRKLDPPAKGRRLVFDKHRDAPKGFGVRITAAGRRVFVLRYLTERGKDRLLTIGDYPTWSVAAARKRATEYRREIDSGADVLGERRQRAAEPTVADAAERFLEAKASLKSHRDIRAALHNHLLPALADTKLQEVRRREIIALVEKLAASKPRQAALLLTYTKQLWAWAEDREIIDANPVATLQPGKITKALHQPPRDRVLSASELAALWNTSEAPAGMSLATLLALKMILATGQRPGEVAGMRWDEISGNLWTIPANRRGKTETAHTVPLTASARSLLDEARATSRQGAAHVFETRTGAPIAAPALPKAVARCTEALQVEEPRWRPHDLRRTVRTGLAAAGVTETVAELTIGHTRKGIAAVYDLHRYDREKRSALEAWERRLLHLVSGTGPRDNVVALDKAKA